MEENFARMKMIGWKKIATSGNVKKRVGKKRVFFLISFFCNPNPRMDTVGRLDFVFKTLWWRRKKQGETL